MHLVILATHNVTRVRPNDPSNVQRTIESADIYLEPMPIQVLGESGTVAQ